MKKLYSPENDAELAFLKSILDGEEIDYFVHNDHFGSLHIGPRINLYNTKMIMVAEQDYERACEILKDFFADKNQTSREDLSKMSWLDKARMVIEALLFTWFIPGKTERKKEE